MIVDIFYVVVGALLSIFVSLFSLISYPIPSGIIDSISFFVLKLRYLNGVFPMDTVYSVVVSYLTFAMFFYGLKIALFAFAHIPWIGKGHKLPTLSKKIGKN